ncbi:hypothetical protein ACFLWS_00805 [Chloroflexota bacterium]
MTEIDGGVGRLRALYGGQPHARNIEGTRDNIIASVSSLAGKIEAATENLSQ